MKINRTILKHFQFKIMETMGSQVIQLVISIVLARFLLPENYGVIAIATTIISILNSIVQSSFNTALVQKKELTQLDRSSAFYTMLFISTSLYIGIYMLAPSISRIYGMSELVGLIRVMSISLISGAWVSLQIALVSRAMKFKISFFVNLIGIILQGTVGIGMAIMGFGAWSLAISYLVNQLAVSILYGVLIHWHPSLCFSWKSIHDIWKVGLPLCGAEFINIASSNAFPLIIGGFYTKNQLGIYQKGTSTPTTIVNGITVAINTVFLSMMSQNQENLPQVKEIMRKGTRIASFLMIPLVLGIAAITREFIYIILGPQWKESIIYMQLTCLMLSMYPLRIKLQAIKSIGKAKQSLICNSIHAGLSCLFLALFIKINLKMAVISLIVSEIAYCISAGCYVKTFLQYQWKEQFADYFPSLFMGLVMTIAVFMIETVFVTPSFGVMLLKIICGVVIYAALAFLIRPMPVRDIFEFFKNDQ